MPDMIEIYFETVVLSFLSRHFCPLFLSRETGTFPVDKSQDSLSIHSSSPRRSITFKFLSQLKDAYLCKGERHQLLLHHSGKGDR